MIINAEKPMQKRACAGLNSYDTWHKISRHYIGFSFDEAKAL